MASSLNVFRAGSLRLTSVRSPVLVLPMPRHRLLSTITFPRTFPRYQKPQLDTRWRNARWNSSAAAPGGLQPPLPTPPPPPPPSPPVDIGSFVDSDSFLTDSGIVADTIAAIPPLQHGDLAALGLCHWTPSGLVQYSFELIHISTGLPWFHTFILATVFWRLVIFPFAVIGMRHTARLRPISKEMNAIQQEAAVARVNRDTLAMQRAALAASKLRADAGVNMLGLMAPMIQLPISIGLFLGIKRMCELPVIQLTQSGFEWLPDLTQPGPYYILPLLVAASGNVMISMGARDMDPSRPEMGHLMNGMRVITIFAVWWMNSFPSGLLLSLLVTSIGAAVQSAIFRVPAFRAALGIPPWTPPPAGSAKLPTMRDTFRQYILQQASPQTPQRPQVTSRVQAYVPPLAPTPPLTPPPPAAAKQPQTLDMVAQQAQAHASLKSSNLYEDSAAPAAKPAAKKTKAVKKTRDRRA
ncbi:60Kd inner membrane protein-domain-containing protein [Mycena maculata]|uniref:60Kd inner membrane protein-domain-containing protein n=1 Tax=Mycena maculata TaxID=230809 RepID=A0AAD7NN05_9AGAR|nr:60Kd inner membrane protein-domain-containing protein [Mycena maculata]